jgi:hypothetical protein
VKQRSEEERIAELNAKIAAIQARGERKKARANPAVKQGMIALKAIDKASAATEDATARKALGGAREQIGAWLAAEGLAVNAAKAEPEAPAPKRRRKPEAVAT